MQVQAELEHVNAHPGSCNEVNRQVSLSRPDLA
jgi:hypothetical protein